SFYWTSILLIPGQSFAIISLKTIEAGFWGGLLTSIGSIISHLTYVSITLIEMDYLTEAPMTIAIIKFVGCAYLAYLGIKLWFKKGRSKKRPSLTNGTEKNSLWLYIRQGFLCSIFSPKSFVFFSTMATLAVDLELPLKGQFLVVSGVVIIGLIWWAFLVGLLSREKIRNFYQEKARVIERVSAMFLFGLSVDILLFYH
nr:LysE family translocator [Prochloraceae cyanobacterium]